MKYKIKCTHTFTANAPPCEQCRNSELERIVGSSDRCFQLMRLQQTATQTCSGDRFTLRPTKRTVADVFRRLAKAERFSDVQVQAFLDLAY